MQFTKITWTGERHTKTVRIPIWRLGDDAITWIVTERAIEVHATRPGESSVFLGAVSIDGGPISDITIDLEEVTLSSDHTASETLWFPPENPLPTPENTEPRM